MKKFLCVMLAVMLAAVSAMSAMAMTKEEAQAAADAVTGTTTDKSLISSPFIDVIQSVQSSVVGVNNYQNYTYYSSDPYGFGSFWGFGYGYGDGRNNRTPSTESVEKLTITGSGVVVYEGLVLTNCHVVSDATRLTISVLGEEEEYAATLMGYDEAADIAVLYAPELKLPAVPLGDSDQLQVGEWSIIIGNPIRTELRGTVTTGIISALDREISSTTTTDKYGLKTNVVNTMIQTNAAINSGNSGGGLFNMLGQLMGIPSMKLSSNAYSSSASIEGIGFAIPINTAKSLINSAIVKVLTGEETVENTKKDNTEVPVNDDKPMLGITVKTINASNDYSVYYGKLPGGLLISELDDNGPAKAAGIQPYDIIVEADGIITSNVNALREALDKHTYGDTVQVKVYRAEGLAEAETISEIGKGEYIDIEVALFEFNAAA